MIQILNLNNNIGVIHIGDNKEEFLRFFDIIKSCNAQRDPQTNCFVVDSQFLELFQEQFETQMVQQPWEKMGADMKLPPFSYQKEAIYFGLNNLNSLMILPPGTGKFFFLKI